MFRYKNYVYEVYKEGSISRAAANLYISQPSLSARIIKIETEGIHDISFTQKSFGTSMTSDAIIVCR